MYKIKKILLPTDLSENAADAYKPAQQLAARYGAKISLINIIPSAKYINDAAAVLGINSVEREKTFDNLKERVTDRLNEVMEGFEPENRGNIIVGIDTNPTQAIAEEANNGGYDIMVMALRGHHETELMRGSITKKVMRASQIPVLTASKIGLKGIKNILVPTDGSRASLKALPWAALMARAFDAKITLLHVIVLQWVSLVSDLRPSMVEQTQKELLTTLDGLLTKSDGSMLLQKNAEGKNELIFDDATDTVELSIVVEEGVSANTTISDYANSHADLVIMTTHGRSGFSNLLMGSVAEMVSQQVSQPIITIKPRHLESIS